MIIGTTDNCGDCPHDDISAVDELYVLCNRCDRLLSVVLFDKTPFKNLVTRELFRERQDGINEAKDNFLTF